MLSEETAVGEYATDTVRTMSDVAEAAEGWPRTRTTPAGAAAAVDDDRVAWAVAHAAVQAAEDLRVAAIVCPTQSGTTARRVAAFRPSVPIAGIATQPDVLGRLSLVWGVRPLLVPVIDGHEEQMRAAVRVDVRVRLVQEGRPHRHRLGRTRQTRRRHGHRARRTRLGPTRSTCDSDGVGAEAGSLADLAGVDAVRRVELPQDARDVHAHRLLADEERVGNLAVGATAASWSSTSTSRW